MTDKKIGAVLKPVDLGLPDRWWAKLDHPLTDADFVVAYCDHVLCTTKDHSLVMVRNRAHRFIRNYLAPEMDRDLQEYREYFA